LNGTASPFGFWTSAAPWLALVAFGLAVALLRARPAERATYLNTLWLFLVGIGGEAAASLIWALNFWWLLAGIAAGYAFAWVGHFFFEKNRPATFTHPLYSFMGDWVMWKDMLTGRIRF